MSACRWWVYKGGLKAEGQNTWSISCLLLHTACAHSVLCFLEFGFKLAWFKPTFLLVVKYSGLFKRPFAGAFVFCRCCRPLPVVRLVDTFIEARSDNCWPSPPSFISFCWPFKHAGAIYGCGPHCGTNGSWGKPRGSDGDQGSKWKAWRKGCVFDPGLTGVASIGGSVQIIILAIFPPPAVVKWQSDPIV